MMAAASVRAAWDDLAHRHGLAAADAEAVLGELVRAYAEPHRRYHTLDHIAALLRLLDQHGAGLGDRDAVVLAILFHDAVYDPARRDNEAASATLASERLTRLGLPAPLVAKVERFIRATQHGHAAPDTADADLALLLDLDLSVLASPWEAYRAYAEAIRQEYSIYPDALYRPGRRRVLEAFLAQERIYLTGPLRSLWESTARTNLARELADLA